jgi:RNA polymerase sigma factor (sigma-70 family)
LLTAEELSIQIKGCSQNERDSQKKLYNSFYGYAMSICDRYTSREEDATEILNDGFLKIFKEIQHFKPSYADIISSFKGWLRKIMIYTAIDHFRKNNKFKNVAELDGAIIHLPVDEETAIDKISYDEIIRFIKQLSPAYRTVLNLFVVEGLSHDEIATKLAISSGTSKSNLAKARKQLQKILYQQNKTLITRNAG